MKKCCSNPTDQKNNHPDHAKEKPNLNRISGQIDGIKKMIDEKRYCPDILTQLRAARASLKTIEANILERHLGACLSDALKQGSPENIDKKLQEIKEIFKRYDS